MAKVTLITHTPEPDRLVAAAARLCYSRSAADKLLQELTPEKTGDFLRMLKTVGHESPFEHASFTFAIEGVSRTLLAQITRHRIASFSVRSQRYVSERDFGFVTPRAIEDNPEAQKAFEKAMESAGEAYSAIADILSKSYETEGMEKSAARKKAGEDARFVLPGSCETQMLVTMNARSLTGFFKQRCCARAQWEIRAVADEMLRLCRSAAPLIFEGAGPACLKGPCPEGKMTCGKIEEVRGRYR
ncbi:MAG: FAD-dependent thymidylate synthase [Oscillospiraceae bacterium]|jgi:thymidylate synthase (FAD)|nr:FAD-dependent thymidylate synthase [Oscillospiraceae bacterium]